MRVADYIMRFIAEKGVKHVFVVAGGGAMHLNDALARSNEVTYVCNHHEQASAIAAENYAKASGNLGVAMVTTGPGGTNAMTGLAGAWLDSTPVLFLSGQVKRADRMYRPDGTPLGVRQRGPQELDIISLVRPITKYAVTIQDPLSIRQHLERAVHLARSGRPGPVWLDIPLDVQASPIDGETLTGFDASELSDPKQDSAFEAEVSEVIARFNAAQRPLIFAGNGVRSASAQNAFQQLIEMLKVPVATTWLAMDLIDESHPLFVGRPGTVAPRGANFALQNCDFLLAIGTRLDAPLMGWNPQQFARGAHKTVVDVDPAELAKLDGIVQTRLCADAGAFLSELLRQRDQIRDIDRTCWAKRCQNWKMRYPILLPEHQAPGPISVYNLAKVISEETGPDDEVVSGSSGSAIEVFLLAYPSKKGHRVYHTAGLGAMGFAIPASIGVCLATGGRRIVCVDGDGGFQLNVQELATIAHLQLPIKFFVLNNDGYASIRATQKNYFGGPNIGCSPSTGMSLPDFRKVARAYGLKTASIEDQGDLRGQVRRVLRMSGPVVCNVRLISDEVRAPRVSSMQRPDGSFVSKPLEDLWPFLDRDEFEQNMLVAPVVE